MLITIILRNRAEYRRTSILSRRGRRSSWLKSGGFRKIEQDDCFIIQHIDNKAQAYSRKTGGDLYLSKKKLVTFDRARTCMNESGSFNSFKFE